MVSLKPPDTMFLAAAEGWLDLGDHLSANDELERITASLRAHPDVLQIRWRVYAQAKKWEDSLHIADALVMMAPERPEGWLYRSLTLHHLNRTRDAVDQLMPALELFRDEEEIPYSLACYHARLGLIKEAVEWLHKSFALGDEKKLKLRALNDPDLESIW